MRRAPRWSDGKPHNTSDASRRVVIAMVSVVVAIIIVVAAVVVAAVVGAFGSLLLGHVFPIIQIIIISSRSHPQARATIVGIIAVPIVLRLGRLSVF
jgi:hypothetical protein